ncbi:MAG: hypothetical protein EA396_04975 [Anaerolineaceae bacterium]|nr:MAG: hypothetical protein EA396_04975 [Anaerolineaceae bacterium]
MSRILTLCLWLGVLIVVGCAPAADEQITVPTRVNLIIGDEPTPAPTVTANAPSGNVAGTLRLWEAQAGRLSGDAPDLWQFSAFAGDEVIVRVVGMPVMLTLYGADGEPLADGETIIASLPQDAVYTVRVQPAESGMTGAYQIGVGYANQPNPNITAPTDIPLSVGVPTPTYDRAPQGAFIGQLIDGQTIGETFGENLAPHLYTFGGEAGEYVRIEMRAVNADVYPRLTLHAPDGQPIATDSESGGDGIAVILNARLSANGLHTVRAASDVAGGYSVALMRYAERAAVVADAPDAPTMTPLPTHRPLPTTAFASNNTELLIGGSALGILSEPTQTLNYTLNLQAGQTITLGASPTAGSDARLQIELRDPDGQLVANANSASLDTRPTALIRRLQAAQSGSYRLLVSAYEGQTGGFIISYDTANQVGGNWLSIQRPSPPFGARQSAELSYHGQRDVWPVTLRAGDVITVGVTPAETSLLDPVVEIVAESAQQSILISDADGGSNRAALIRDFAVPADGVYLIRVRADASATTGGYGLIWRYVNAAPTPTAPPATYPLLIQRDSVADSAYNFYPFYAHAGQTVQVYVEAQDDAFDPVAALIAPDGAVLAEVDDSDGTLNPRFIHTLPADGTYQVRVNGYLSGGAFRVRVDVVAVP